MIKDPKVGMKVRNTKGTDHTIYTIKAIDQSDPDPRNHFVDLEIGQWRTTWHLESFQEDWEEDYDEI